MGLPDLVKTCDLFVYLNVQFRSFQFEEEEELEVPKYFRREYSSFPGIFRHDSIRVAHAIYCISMRGCNMVMKLLSPMVFIFTCGI